jgi:hypothetical protein
VVDTEVERPQAPAHDVRRTERLAIAFQASDKTYPEVLALREDFPHVPHLNHTRHEIPRSLCLYDRPWPEIALRWTPSTFIERIRYWLGATARGELHQDDQPLEPLLLNSGFRIILPADINTDLGGDAAVQLDVFRANASDRCRTFIAVRPQQQRSSRTRPNYVATTLVAAPQAHGIIRRSPSNFAELHDFLASGGIDLIQSLRERLIDWNQPGLLDTGLIVVVALPLSRSSDAAVERFDFWAFFSPGSIREVGVGIGLWTEHEGAVGRLVPPDDSKGGADLPVHVMLPYLGFSRTAAASANNVDSDLSKILAVGVGALGSQVVMTLARTGFGEWTLVDEDDVLPHNLARHALPGSYVGQPKADAMAHALNALYLGAATAIDADILAPGEAEESLNEALNSAELILDFSASVPVARLLAIDTISPARRMSVFLNPQGTDVVLLVEDRDRTIPLDVLEVQYYHAAATMPELLGHLDANPGRLRYGRSCSDVSTSMPTHIVAMSAALVSRAIRIAHQSSEPTINVWRCDPQTLGVTPIHITPSPCPKQTIGDWTLVLDQNLLRNLADIRVAKLSNETGGVLIGHYDLQRRIIYVVDTIPSPPDSEEWPTLYIRGSEGLLPLVNEFSNRTAGQLEYVGEWHSHPDGCSTLPSSDDVKVFAWLTEHLASAGLPALMAIVGEQQLSNWYLGHMYTTGGWSVSG